MYLYVCLNCMYLFVLFCDFHIRMYLYVSYVYVYIHSICMYLYVYVCIVYIPVLIVCVCISDVSEVVQNGAKTVRRYNCCRAL